ncbi:MAG: Asp-tRNA(Asn)/Glu-tRNA(Gln) amidotransferase subunit GatC [Bacillota bacterium]
MPVTRKDVEHIAELARLNFEENELESFTAELNNIITYVEKLNELDTEGVEPLSYPVEGHNKFREDKPGCSASHEDALKNAPDRDEDFFKVPKVIGS